MWVVVADLNSLLASRFRFDSGLSSDDRYPDATYIVRRGRFLMIVAPVGLTSLYFWLRSPSRGHPCRVHYDATDSNMTLYSYWRYEAHSSAVNINKDLV